MKRIKTLFEKVMVSIGMCLLLGITGAQAASLTVTTTADGGFGSLRQAIIDAQANAEANVVGFNIPLTDPGYSASENRFTINLSTSLPDIPLAAMTIGNDQPQAVTVRGNDTFRIFTLVDSAVVIINNLTIRNGSNVIDFGKNKSFGGTAGLGGGIFMGASATLTLNECSLSSNVATDGGAIYVNNSGTLNINGSTFSDNTASNNGGAIYNGISGTVNADSNTLNGNSAATGGALYNGANGTINARSSTFDANTASISGGGIYNSATMTLTNNTVSSNSAAVGGGGIYNNFVATLNNNLVALNTAPDGSDLLGRGSLGSAYTGTYNLIGNADGSEGVGGAPNQSGTTAIPILPLLGPLQNNGGETFTRALLSGSPAIDKGNSAMLIADQRDQLRPYDNMMITNTGNGADVGAFEAQLAPTSAEVSVGGRILDGERGISGASVSLTDASGIVRTARTNAFGYYNFQNVEAGEVYIFNARHKSHQFTPQAVTVFNDMTELNFTASPSPANRAGVTGIEEVSPISVSLPSLAIEARELTLIVPITVGDLTGRNVLAFDFELHFDPNFLRLTGSAPTSNAGTLSSDFVITANPNTPGRVLVSGYGIYPLSGEGTLLNLNFEVIRDETTSSSLTWQMFMFNEGDPSSEATDGWLSLKKPKGLIRVPRTP